MKTIVERFKFAIEKNRLSHLYLLSGSLGITKRNLVQELIYLIFKHYNDYDNLKQQLEHFNHPNLVYLKKEGQTIKKEQIMELQAEFSKTSLVEGPRIFVIEQAETMSNQAANSLLKFLEEPKDQKTIGFLLVDDMNFILPTIQSRAQVIRLIDTSDEEFIALLTDNEVDIKDAHFIANMTKTLSEALSIYANETYMQATTFIDEFVLWLKNPKQSLMPLFESISQVFYQDKEYILFVLDILAQIFLDILHLHMNQKVQYEFMMESLLEFVKSINSNTAQQVVIALQKAKKDLRLPLNMTLYLTALSIDIEKLIRHD